MMCYDLGLSYHVHIAAQGLALPRASSLRRDRSVPVGSHFQRLLPGNLERFIPNPRLLPVVCMMLHTSIANPVCFLRMAWTKSVREKGWRSDESASPE